MTDEEAVVEIFQKFNCEGATILANLLYIYDDARIRGFSEGEALEIVEKVHKDSLDGDG